MQIVIDIPEEMYQKIKETSMFISGRRSGRTIDYTLFKAVNFGTPLPKGHGRLIDENGLIDEIVCEEIDGRYYDVIYAHSIYDAETIIEADKEEEK